MSALIYESTYKDVKAVAFENEKILVKFLPGHGGKLASFLCKKSGRELLVQAEGNSYKELEYDGDYVESECSGFDDMFPTIDKTYYINYPWKGVEIPDHGEVCGLKWDYTIEDNCLHMHVNGVRFPYKLEKWIRADQDDDIRIDYKLTNSSDFDMDFIWAGHIMLNARDGAELLLPYEEGAEAICVFSSDVNLGQFGDTVVWPETQKKDGKSQRLDITHKHNARGNSYKYYFKEEMPDNWFGYRYPDDKLEIIISLPKDKVPYLGIWVNEGSFKNYHSIAPEPCTGTFDKPEMAKSFGQNSVLKAKSEYSWFLRFELRFFQ